MNKLDKYKKVVRYLDDYFLNDYLLEEGYRFCLIVRTDCNFICFDEDKLLFTDTIEKGVRDKETDFNEILEKCKRRYEDHINEFIKYKTK